MSKTICVAKVVLLDRNGDFLLLQRSDTHPSLAGFYDLPGGMIEHTEEPGEAVVREVSEETGIELGRHRLAILYTTTHLIERKSYPTLLYTARIDTEKPEIQLSWEHKSYEWASLDRLPEVEPQLAPTYREALQYIRDNNILEDIDVISDNIKALAV